MRAISTLHMRDARYIMFGARAVQTCAVHGTRGGGTARAVHGTRAECAKNEMARAQKHAQYAQSMRDVTHDMRNAHVAERHAYAT